MKNRIYRLVMAALLAAMGFVATAVLRIPSPLGGYINLGDSVVLLTGCLASPLYGFLAAGIGSALADVAAGYVLYAPVTFLIKGGMALLTGLVFRWRRQTLSGVLLGGCAAELVMIIGYYVYEGFLYGFVPSLINIPPNAVQGIAGLTLGTAMVHIFHYHIRRNPS